MYLTCQARGKPGPSVRWLKDNVTVSGVLLSAAVWSVTLCRGVECYLVLLQVDASRELYTVNTTSLSRPGHQARGSVTVLSTLYFRSDDDVCPLPLLSADAANYNNYITAAFYFLPLIIRIINLHFTDHYPASTRL